MMWRTNAAQEAEKPMVDFTLTEPQKELQEITRDYAI
jgi:hypothetical protein